MQIRSVARLLAPASGHPLKACRRSHSDGARACVCTPGPGRAVIHGVDQTEISLYLSLPIQTNAEFSHFILCLEISSGTSRYASASEKRPTFGFRRRIRDDPALLTGEL